MSRPPKVVAIDFETDAIEGRPKYPPKPVGVAIQEPGKKAEYLAWGHPTENNCTEAAAKRRLKDLWQGKTALLFHHAKFDLDVAESHLGLRLPDWRNFHDTLFLAFLMDPHAETHSLKPFTQRVLGIAPTERDAVREWILANVPEAKKGNWGAFISHAPGKLVGQYAAGDVTRTLALFKHCWGRVVGELDMLEAYERERRLLPALLYNERRGIQTDIRAMRADQKVYVKAMQDADAYLRKMLKAKELNIDSNDDLADAIERAGFAHENGWLLTPKGKRSTSKESISAAIKNPKLATALRYRAALATCLGTFLEPWLASAEAGGGVLYPDWNQVRQSRGESSHEKGTRTGRLSVSRFMNVPKEFLDMNDEPLQAPPGLPPLPVMRKYLVPRKGMRWGKRDYNQQELRILAHFESGGMLQEYTDNPFIDRHDAAKARILEATGQNWPRKDVKITNFGIIYGMGAGKLALKIKRAVDEAKALRTAIYSGYPDLKELEKEVKRMGKSGEPIVTWGGRRYFCEEPVTINGKRMTFEYKLLNYLIQGSAADCTKEAIIRYHELTHGKDGGQFVVTVHDEINMEAPKAAFREEMEKLRLCMEGIEFDVLMLSDGEYSDTSWHDLKDWNDRRAA